MPGLLGTERGALQQPQGVFWVAAVLGYHDEVPRTAYMESSRISGNGCLAKICLIEGSIFRPNVVAECCCSHTSFTLSISRFHLFFLASQAMAAEKSPCAPCVARPMLLSGEKKMPLTDWWSKLEGGTAG